MTSLLDQIQTATKMAAHAATTGDTDVAYHQMVHVIALAQEVKQKTSLFPSVVRAEKVVTGINQEGQRVELNEFAAQHWREGILEPEAFTDVREEP